MEARSSESGITQPMLCKHRSGHLVPSHLRTRLHKIKQWSLKRSVVVTLGMLLLTAATVALLQGNATLNRARQQSESSRLDNATSLLAKTFGLSSQNEARALLDALEDGTLDYEAVAATLEEVESKKIAEIKAAADAEAAKKIAEVKAAAEKATAENVAAAKAAAEQASAEKVAAARAAAEKTTAEKVAAAKAAAEKLATTKKTAEWASNRLRSKDDVFYDDDVDDDEDDLVFDELDDEDDAFFDRREDDRDVFYDGFDDDGDEDDNEASFLYSWDSDFEDYRDLTSARGQRKRGSNNVNNQGRGTPTFSRGKNRRLPVQAKNSRQGMDQMSEPSLLMDQRRRLDDDSEDEDYGVDFRQSSSSLRSSYRQNRSPHIRSDSKAVRLDAKPKAGERGEDAFRTRKNHRSKTKKTFPRRFL